MSSTSEPMHLSNHHRNTLRQLFQHPVSHNIGWNAGAISGQEIFHAHLHVIPRFKDEPHAGKGIRYWLKDESNLRPSLVDK